MNTPGAVPVPDEIAALLRDYLNDGQPLADTTAARGYVFDKMNGLRDLIHVLSPNAAMPVDSVRWVPLGMVTPNEYNPNHVAKVEMVLLLRSIMHDGYTQPVVTVWNPERSVQCRRCTGVGREEQAGDKFAACLGCSGAGTFHGCFEIVDGFHRFFCLVSNDELLVRTQGRIPVVVLEKGMNDRMASTVRHNRARGKHSVTGMANMVFKMLDNGMDDAAICNELGMEPEELVRLKHITGFSKLFKDTAYNRAWQTKNQIRLKKAQEAVAAGNGAGAEFGD